MMHLFILKGMSYQCITQLSIDQFTLWFFVTERREFTADNFDHSDDLPRGFFPIFWPCINITPLLPSFSEILMVFPKKTKTHPITSVTTCHSFAHFAHFAHHESRPSRPCGDLFESAADSWQLGSSAEAWGDDLSPPAWQAGPGPGPDVCGGTGGFKCFLMFNLFQTLKIYYKLITSMFLGSVGTCWNHQQDSGCGEVIEGANGPNKHRFRGQPIPWVGSEGCN